MLFSQPPFYTEDLNQLYQKIKNQNLTFPSSASNEAQDLLSKLLKKDPKERLGAENKQEIKSHPWFRDIDWDDVLAKKLDPPFLDEYEEDIDHTRRRLKINDKDYTKDNWKFMRVDDFEFVRESEIDGQSLQGAIQSFNRYSQKS
jgi:serine/threonine protein kinase